MTISRRARSPDDPRPLAVGAAAVYAAVLASLGVLPGWGAALALVVLGAVAATLLARHPERVEPLLAAWPPLHLALFLTGSLESPLAPLAAVWAALLARRSRGAAVAALALPLLVPAAAWLHGAPVEAAPLARWALLAAAGAGLGRLLTRSAGARGEAAEAAPDAQASPAAGPKGEPGDAEALGRLLELVRRATDAHEAALWRMEPGGRTAVRLGWAAVADAPEPPAAVELEGHPFGWAILEQVHVRLERGKRVLPTPWAAEMLLVPVDAPDGVLGLAYPGVVPPGTEPVALEAGTALGTLLSLLGRRRVAERADAAVRAVLDAVRSLPGELEVAPFAARLAETVRVGTSAAGAAVVLAPVDTTPGRILHVAAEAGREPRVEGAVGESDTRLGLALKHGVELAYADLRRERERIPLLGAREQWPQPPRSLALLPLAVEGRTLGAVAAWHPDAGHFGEREMELLRRIASVAPLPMRSATQFEELGRRANTDALTGLPNRAAFETRLAAAAGYFDRYGRPFSLAILDVDHFKKFNDTWGHEAGDRVLAHVAEVLRGTVREVDLPARLGGEEFVVVMPETGLRAAAEAAERVRRAIEGRPVIWNGRPLSVTVSAGVASCPDCLAAPAEVLAAADAALYRSKAGGRNRVSAAPRAAAAAGPGSAPI